LGSDVVKLELWLILLINKAEKTKKNIRIRGVFKKGLNPGSGTLLQQIINSQFLNISGQIIQLYHEAFCHGEDGT
jgi:hypothetical protein